MMYFSAKRPLRTSKSAATIQLRSVWSRSPSSPRRMCLRPLADYEAGRLLNHLVRLPPLFLAHERHSICKDPAGLKDQIGFRSAFSPMHVPRHQIFIPSSFLAVTLLSWRVTFFLHFLCIMYRVSEGVITPGCTDCLKFQMSSRKTERRREEKKPPSSCARRSLEKKNIFPLHVFFFFFLTGKLSSIPQQSFSG